MSEIWQIDEWQIFNIQYFFGGKKEVEFMFRYNYWDGLMGSKVLLDYVCKDLFLDDTQCDLLELRMVILVP